VGPIPDGMLVLHTCDNPPCVNPDHLYLGTWKDNMQDRIKRGRNPKLNMTHCKNGHEYSKENLRYNCRGERCCKACDKMARMRKKERQNA
jgi:hypothetical protein